MRTIGTALAGLMFGASVAAIAASGCWNLAGDCEAMKSCRENPDEPQDDGGTPLDAPTDAPLPDCEPSPSEDGSVLRDECGIFVIPGVEGGDGTSTDPVGTLGTALALASSRDLKRVYVCEGDLSEEVNVPPGIEIYGGLACEDEWKTGEAKTSLTAPAGQVPLRLSEGDGSGPTRIEGFEVTAEMGVTLGQSSVAVIVGDVDAAIVRCLITAQAGMIGKAGAWGGEAVPSALPGAAGTAVCTATPLGGALTASTCDATGGEGGNGSTVSDDPAKDGQSGKPLNKGGAGGKAFTADNGNYNVACTVPSVGGAGKDGDNGSPGKGGGEGNGDVIPGSLSMDKGYVGRDGVAGGIGTPGGGGGGGGGRMTQSCSGVPGPGVSGASGGAGGCNGKGGGGGQAGGSSIALISLVKEKSLTLTETTLRASTGGNGGSGGAGQPGGAGGKGGNAASASDCPGGAGGKGGRGGNAGGGAGGHSIGIAYKYKAPSINGIPIEIEAAGAAGTGGGTGAGTGAPGHHETTALLPEN
jgi:hypothetical protein